jgi:hypothetical protein
MATRDDLPGSELLLGPELAQAVAGRRQGWTDIEGTP